MEARTISGALPGGKLTVCSLCQFLLLVTGLAAKEPWVSKSVDDWIQKDVEEILSDSPWVRREGVRIIPTEERGFHQSLSGLFGEKDLYWVRFIWLAEPIQETYELIKRRSFAFRIDSPVLEFVTACQALERWQNLTAQSLGSDDTVRVMLQGIILSGLIGTHNELDVRTAFLSTQTGGRITASSLLFGVSELSYEKGEAGIEQAVVGVEELAKEKPTDQRPVEQTPPSTIICVDHLNEAHSVQLVILTFPREALGREEVEVVVPIGGKYGITTRFQPAEMLVLNSQSF